MTKATLPTNKKKTAFALSYLIFILLLLEGTSRIYWSTRKHVPFFASDIILKSYYPELRKVMNKQVEKKNGRFDILLLGGSVLTKRHGNIKQLLEEKLTYRTRKEIKIFNVSDGGHTSLDSYYKYKNLQNKHFDLVVFYHALNELRTNNCPPSFFKSDYSHYHWYKIVNELDRHPLAAYITFPFTFRFFTIKIKELNGSLEFLPRDSPRGEWLDYGREIKTAASFRTNLSGILEIADRRKEPVLLMSYVSYVPENYSLAGFENKELDYTLFQGAIEMWGKKENIIAGINTHNKIIKELAGRYRASYIDQQKLMPKSGRYFNDICHFTCEGCNLFVDNMLDEISKIMKDRKL
ncbi:MAG: hypothetical protein ACE5GM_06825 [bacterium]